MLIKTVLFSALIGSTAMADTAVIGAVPQGAVLPIPPSTLGIPDHLAAYASATLDGDPVPIIRVGNNASPFFLVYADFRKEPGDYPLIVRDRGLVVFSGTVQVNKTQFPRVTFPQGTGVPMSAALLRRIEEEREIKHRIFSHKSASRVWERPFFFPVDSVHITSPFGQHRRLAHSQRWRRHAGVDLKVWFNNPSALSEIRAIGDGIVLWPEAGRELYFEGNMVVIYHEQNIRSVYMHMSHISVQPGDEVRSGQIIGVGGQSGRVTGPHLHLEVHIGAARIDPLLFIETLNALYSRP